ncbi:hypothetical protein Bbelb_125950 [Branchiostoma belcheri]|nr:hypothetical protein Bbelb_125950 [Branchiostoma belcheri]
MPSPATIMSDKRTIFSQTESIKVFKKATNTLRVCSLGAVSSGVTMFKTVFVCFIALATAKKYTVQPIEKGVVFSQEIDIDQASGVRRVSVPQHNSVAAAEIIHSYHDGLTLYCQTEEGTCFLMPLADRNEPGQAELQAGLDMLQRERSGFLPDWETEVVVNQWAVVGRAERGSLSPVLAAFHADLPVYMVEKIDDSALLLGSSPAVHPASPLTRRQTCGNGADPVRQYAVSNPAGCEYLVFCDVDHTNGNYNDCPRRHVLDQFFMACLCCPEHTTREQCIYCVNLE